MPFKKALNSSSVWLSVFCVVLLSCNENKHKENSVLVDSIINKTSWVYNDDLNKEQAVSKLQYILNTDKQLPVKARYQAYHSLYFYQLYKNQFEKSLLYADSMIYTIEHSTQAKRHIDDLARAYYFKGDALFKLKAYEEAYRNYFLGKKLMPEIKDKCESSNYNYRIAMILYKQGKYSEAGTYFRLTLDEVRQCSTSFSEVFRQQELLNNIALCYSRADKIDSAIIYYNAALKYVGENDTTAQRKKYYLSARGVIYGNMGGEMLRKKAYSKAEDLLKQSIAINDLPGLDSVDAVTAKIKLIKVYLETGRLDSAHKYLEILRKDKDRLNILDYKRTYYSLNAKYLDAIGSYSEAFIHLEKYAALSDSLQKEMDKLKSISVDERFRNLSNENEINALKREAEIQQRYLYITFIIVAMAIAIVVLIYTFWRKSKKNIKMLTGLNNEISLQKNKLEEALTQLGLSDKEKDTILRAVAHDLRNPVVGISSLTKLMILEDVQGLNKDKLTLIDRACNNALTLIDDIIEAAENKQQANFEDRKKQADVIEIVKNAIALSNYRADEKQQRIRFETTVTRLEVHIYAQKVARVISNLINNAIKFSEIGQEIRVRVEKRAEDVLFKIIDHGIGIPDKYGDDVFQLFTSSKRFGTQGEKSYGLGLSICKQIVIAHGGKIWYEANAEGGTVFFFTLPL
ncbi:tetratricopeptide repeat-containing sensor histidine kinase [Pedobacter sp. UBA4863]|uniref:tetratricopeptide repeat-containing sensor histidine kinase n=1 Tax=Pedobacter sp. UBA4863 TaxID=1947060 RepID=UPI0025F763F1|nr:tetratricopeptide repeat-containing sensor histidine kinase [Pedobacter sp. UBA4863]